MSLLTAVSVHPHLRSSLTQPRLPLGPQPRSPCSWSLVPGTSGGGQCSPSSRKAPVETSSGGSSHTSSRSGVRKSILREELGEGESTLPTQLLGSPFLTCHPRVSHHSPSSPATRQSRLRPYLCFRRTGPPPPCPFRRAQACQAGPARGPPGTPPPLFPPGSRILDRPSQAPPPA